MDVSKLNKSDNSFQGDIQVHSASDNPGERPRRRLLRTLFRNGPVVLFYHGVEERIRDPRVQSVHLPFSVFEQHISYLRKHFEIISLGDLLESFTQGYSLEPNQIVLTFDDGYKNNLTVVSPFLTSLNVPFSVFVSTRHISERLRFPTYYVRAALYHCKQKTIRIFDKIIDISTDAKRTAALTSILGNVKRLPHDKVEKMLDEIISILPKDQWSELDALYSSDEPMNWIDVRKLHDKGADVGSHSHDHFIFHDNQSKQEIDHQLMTSKKLISENIGGCDFIAYPNGSKRDIFPGALARVIESKYLLGFTTIPGEISPELNPYLLPRIGASLFNMQHFKLRIHTCFRHNKKYYQWLAMQTRHTGSS
jgi:peptidoglycan/xylan/chitin deacetylase (PgdA/CDA1 family)